MMTDAPVPGSFIELLADHLAKLREQLRHLLGSTPAATAPERSFAVVNRLRAAGAALAAGPPAGDLSRLAVPTADLARDLAAAPERVPAHLLTPCERLADTLERCLADLDRGRSPAQVAADPGWEGVLAGFLNAGTLLQDLDAMEDLLTAWSRRYGDTDLSRTQEDALRRRWALLRAYGDSLFGGGASLPRSGGPDAPDFAGRRVLLLLDSPFRRALLAERLTAAGCDVEDADSPDHLADRVADPDPPDLLLCDDLEPSRHLATARGRLERVAPGDRPPLVLVAAAGDGADRLLGRAKLLGADGAWAEPWAAAALAPWLGPCP